MLGYKGGYYFAVCLVFSVAMIISAQRRQQAGCAAAKDCTACMRAGPTCAWCEDQNFTTNSNGTQTRCSERRILSLICKNVKSLESKVITLPSEDFSNIVQVRPQRVKLQLRPGQTQSFQIAVQPAENFPVDLYFLIDSSTSMSDDLATLIILAEQIANTIGNITTAFRIGVGIYADKPLSPLISSYPPSIPIFPCDSSSLGKSCRPAFDFVHAFDFSNSVADFKNALIRIEGKLTGDLDHAESPFDGLMQLSVCDQEISWKPKGQGRRIVVIFSDALPKIAGDGKIVGIMNPHVSQCSMESRKVYGYVEKYFSKAKEMDYPSIQQLKHAMLENSVTPIMAVTEDVLSTYKVIAKEWADIGAAADVLSKDSSNIVQLLRDNYNKISTTVTLSDRSPSSLKIEYQVDPTSCTNVDAANQCSNVKLNQTVLFDVKVTLQSCPNDPSQSQQVTINTAGFGKVLIDLEYLCDCNCTQQDNSSICLSSGTYECGICKCNPGRFGSNCKCDSSQPHQNDTSACIDPRSKDQPCNGLGNCVCGRCECYKREFPKVVTGEFCDCLNYGCPLSNGAECAGKGTCECGKCVCNANYEGDNCAKPNCKFVEETKCKSSDEKLCSGNGQCDCPSQTCKCDIGYVGERCEDCRSESCKCATIEDCMRCEILNETCNPNLNCTMHTYMRSNETISTDCTLRIDECFYGINITGNPFQGNESLSIVYRFTNCLQIGPQETSIDDTDVLAYILGIIGGILLLALLLLLIWKLLVTKHDKQEYTKFLKSKEQYSKWEQDGNPIYKEPNQQFDNPAFLGNN